MTTIAKKALEAAREALAEQRAREQEAARIADEQRRQEAAVAEAQRQASAALEAAQRREMVPPAVASAAPAQPAMQASAPKADEPATLNLGTICSRLGFTVSAAFLSDTLHVAPAKTDKRATLFTESQFRTICRQLQSHVSAMAELYAPETV